MKKIIAIFFTFIASNVWADQFIRFGGGGGSASGAAIGDVITGATSGSVLFAGPGGILAQDNAKFFWNDSGDFLGIGNGSPTTALDVTGVGKFSTGIITPLIYPAANSTGAIKIDKADGTTNIVDIDTTNSRVGIGTITPSDTLALVSTNFTFSAGALGLLNQRTTGGGWANFGSPDGYSPLVIYKAGTNSVEAEFTASGPALFNQGGINIFQFGTTGSDYGYLSNNAANTWSLGHGTDVTVMATPVLTWNASGNVGIGSTSPTKNLDVVGTAKISTSLVVPLIYPASDSTTAIKIDKADGTTQIAAVDTTNKRLEVGASAPTHQLQIDGGAADVTSGMGSMEITNDGSGFGPQYRLTNSGAGKTWIILNAATSDDAALGSLEIVGGSGATRLVIDPSSGNVGIGSITPAAKLDIGGTTKLGTAGTAFTAMGACTVSSNTLSTTATNLTCTGVPASAAVAVNCSGQAAFSTPTASGLYCRATGTVSQIACNTVVANSTAMAYSCVWTQP